jgi:N-acetylgalactosamine 4-sulfate 6-O-sulfotransferase
MCTLFPQQSLTFLSHSRSPCWVEVLLPGGSYRRNRGGVAAVTRWRWSRANKKRLNVQTISWRMRCLPAFFLGGFPKCGTTDLYRRLGSHPGIYASKVKEPHWWARKRLGNLHVVAVKS